jgi:hypothetical protein
MRQEFRLLASLDWCKEETAITIPIAISIPQIHPFFNEWLAIELTLVQLRTDTRFSGVRSGITQMVTKFNANSD